MRQVFNIAVIAMGLLCLALAPEANAAGKRVALVIGNSEYSHVSNLPNPVNDAEDLTQALERIGFEVTHGRNLDFREMRLAVRDFAEAAEGADMIVVYFAGHGIEIDNTNYLVPVNAELRSDRDVDLEAIRLDTVVNTVANVNGLKIILVDACRNNPFVSNMARTTSTRSIGRGLGRIDPGGVLVGYAARGGTLALDGEGRNSPYAQAILTHIEEPGLEIGRMFRKIRASVLETTDGYQEPFTYGSLPDEDIFLVPRPLTSAAARPNPPLDTRMLEVAEAFAMAQTENSEVAWATFLDHFGTVSNTPFVPAARANLVALQEAAKPVPERRAETWLDVPYAADGSAELSRSQMMLVQRALSYAGADVGTPDGVAGPRTRTAVASVRLALGLPPSDRIDRALLSQLPDAVAMEPLFTDKARRYKAEDLPAGTEPRLVRAVAALESTKIKFDYYQGRLYLAALPFGGSWQTANNAAQKAGGHLATISDAAENQFIHGLFASDPDFTGWQAIPGDGGQFNGPMFGLYQLPGSSEPRGGWAWVTGEPVRYAPWSQGQPNDYGGTSHYGRFHRFARSASSSVTVDRWDDAPIHLGSTGYIIEIE